MNCAQWTNNMCALWYDLHKFCTLHTIIWYHDNATSAVAGKTLYVIVK